MTKHLQSIFLASVLVLSPVCPIPITIAQTIEESSSSPPGKVLTKDELYFGLSIPGGGLISDAEWQKFLDDVITSRFKDGLTVVDAYGQYLEHSGKLAKEKSKIVILTYESSAEKNREIEEIICLYKQMFRQESVGRITSTVKASF
ncbi:MAG TPA: DUF3574 domain-containing protein [Oculatellaceae cyanobacterium]|jgi:hypothetical protein